MAYYVLGQSHANFNQLDWCFKPLLQGRWRGESLLCFIIQAIHNILISKRFCNQTIPSEVLLSLELPARSPAAASELDALESSLLTSLAKYIPLDLTPTRSNYLFSDFTEGRRGGGGHLTPSESSPFDEEENNISRDLDSLKHHKKK